MSQSDFQTDINAVQAIDAVPRILEVICRTTGMGFAAVARVTENRWVCCAVRDEISFGLGLGGELKIETTICNEIRQSGQAVVIDHVSEDIAFSNHATPAMYGFQSYISVPLMLQNGEFFGTLCAIDPRPARLTSSGTREMFGLFAELIANYLAATLRVEKAEATLKNERASGELRQQLLTVLGHDLRNPLSAIATGVRMIQQAESLTETGEVADIMQTSVGRMSVLLDGATDFATSRLGGNLEIHPRTSTALDHLISRVIRDAAADNIEADIRIAQPVDCDEMRIRQLFSNLLNNAIVHGDRTKPIHVSATTDDGVLRIAVRNSGPPIAPDVMKTLFQPFVRTSGSKQGQGLGLGLFIAAEIARTHGGTIKADGDDNETTFTFEMPLLGLAGSL